MVTGKTSGVAGPAEIMRRYGAIAVALLAVQIDFFAIALALPDMAEDLDTSTTDLQWSVSAYMIAIGIAMVPAGRVAELIGRKRVWLIGFAIFGLASLAVGLSQTPEQVVAFRIIQGLGAGLYFPISFAIVTNSTNAVERPRVIGFLSGVAGVGTALGPILGGGLSSTVGWRWVFLVNVPLVAIALIWAIVQIRESRPDSSLRGSLGKLDWLGVALLALSVIGVSVAIDDFSAGGSTALFTVVPGVLGSAALAAFAWWEFRAREPLIPPRMWRNRQFTALVVAATIANAGVCVLIFVSTVDLQQVRGYSGLIAGLLFIPAAIALAVGGPVSGRLASRFPSQRVMTVVTVAGGLGLVALAFADGLVVLLILMAVAGFLLGLGFQFGNVAVQSVVRPAEAGVGAGILLTIMEIVGGMAVVIAAAILEGVGQGVPTAAGTTVTLVTWGVIVGVLGVVFGLSQWRSATIAAPSGA